MAKETGIAWCHATFNPIWGCTKISPGCLHCYAESDSKRYGFDVWGPGKPRRTFTDKHWNEPLKWHKEAMEKGAPHRVFCGSMCDWAEDEFPQSIRDRMFALIRKTPFLRWLLLTKRANKVAERLPKDWSIANYPNVWLGTSIENNDYVWRARAIAEVPAIVHFISAEPLLGSLDQLSLDHIEWVIVGGESGFHRREMDKAWAVDLMDRCILNKVAFFYKQSGGRFPGADPYLNGVEWKKFPR